MHPLIFRATTPHSPDSWTAGRRRGSRSRLPDISCIIPGSLSVAEDRPDIGGGQDHGEVVRHDIADRTVAGTFDRAGGNHIPERDAVGEEKSLFLIDRVRNRNVQDSGQGFPEAVLRMMVEKMSFPGFDGRERSEDQDL